MNETNEPIEEILDGLSKDYNYYQELDRPDNFLAEDEFWQHGIQPPKRQSQQEIPEPLEPCEKLSDPYKVEELPSDAELANPIHIKELAKENEAHGAGLFALYHTWRKLKEVNEALTRNPGLTSNDLERILGVTSTHLDGKFITYEVPFDIETLPKWIIPQLAKFMFKNGEREGTYTLSHVAILNSNGSTKSYRPIDEKTWRIGAHFHYDKGGDMVAVQGLGYFHPFKTFEIMKKLHDDTQRLPPYINNVRNGKLYLQEHLVATAHQFGHGFIKQAEKMGY